MTENDRNTLIALAKRYYKPDGPNQWPHIQRTIASGDKMADFRGKKLSKPELAAILFHDVAKYDKKYQNLDHGVASSIKAQEILKNDLSKRQIAQMAKAIAAHNLGVAPGSATGELLMAADANKPDMAWYLRKSYNNRLAHGYTDEEALENAYLRVKKGYTIPKYVPDIYRQAYSKEIEQLAQQAKALRRDQVKNIIDQYTKDHPESSIYE